MTEERAEATAAEGERSSPRRVRRLLLLCYLTPLLLLGLFYLPMNSGGHVFWRNWLRAGCGPLAGALPRYGFDPNDIATYAVAFALVWPPWLLAVHFRPLCKLPAAVHSLLGFVWCFGGCCLTFSI
jgi:hypothetical protein